MTTAVWSPRTRLHVPEAEIWLGVRTVGTEVPERVDRILSALRAVGMRLMEAGEHGTGPLTAVHDEALVRHLEAVYDEWLTSGIAEQSGQDRVVPYVFPTAAMLDGLPGRLPAAVHARAGVYCYDTMTLVGPGTWRAARAAADCALTAAELAAAGERSVYALCRPPGHHVTRSAYGGSCYLNNAAVAAQALRLAGQQRVAVVDVDAHHGNGTAAIFYDRADVFYASVHVDPGAGWFPHVVGFADETGAAGGAGTTLNVPLPPGTGNTGWLRGVERLVEAVASFRPAAVVVSLGLDAAADDPESPLQVTSEGYRAAGTLLAGLGVPTVHVQEGGYHLTSLGGLVAAYLRSFEAAAALTG
jgi:acetoin utilization deacetylase AcuC-like enzyme